MTNEDVTPDVPPRRSISCAKVLVLWLIVVVVVVGLLVTVVLSCGDSIHVNRSRERVCRANMEIIAKAIFTYSQGYGGWFPHVDGPDAMQDERRLISKQITGNSPPRPGWLKCPADPEGGLPTDILSSYEYNDKVQPSSGADAPVLFDRKAWHTRRNWAHSERGRIVLTKSGIEVGTPPVFVSDEQLLRMLDQFRSEAHVPPRDSSE